MHTESARDGFPDAKVKVAIRYLTVVKPWWKSYIEKMRIIPIDVPAAPGRRFGATTSTDTSMNLYVDRTFALTMPVHVISGAVEHEVQHHVRDSWNRLLWLTPQQWEKFANIAMDLEINSGMQQEQRSISFDDVVAAIRDSANFSVEELSKWSISEPPGLSGFGWLPEQVGLADDDTAENYCREIIKAYGDLENDEEGQAGDNSEEGGEAGGPAGDQVSTESQDGEQPDAEPDADKEDGEAETGDTPSNADAGADDDGTGDEGGSSSGSAEGGDSEDAQPEESSPDADSGPEGAGSDSTEGSADDDSGTDAASGSPSGSTRSRGSAEGAEEPGDAADPGDGNDGETGDADNGSTADVARAIEALRKESESHDWHAHHEVSDEGDDAPGWLPEDDEYRYDEEEAATFRQIALEKLANDIKEASSKGWGIRPGNALVDWSTHQIRAARGDWETQFRKACSTSFHSAKMQGASDLSYQVRNPNQPKIGPVLQGLHDYTPTVYVLFDVSGSMRPFLERAMSVLAGIVQSSVGIGNKVTWISADVKVQAVGDSWTIDTGTATKISRGFGGTVLARIMRELLSGDFTWERRRYVKPDVLIVLSDCEFEWPYSNLGRLPVRTYVVVASVKPHVQVSARLPGWLEPSKFVYVGE